MILALFSAVVDFPRPKPESKLDVKYCVVSARFECFGRHEIARQYVRILGVKITTTSTVTNINIEPP